MAKRNNSLVGCLFLLFPITVAAELVFQGLHWMFTQGLPVTLTLLALLVIDFAVRFQRTRKRVRELTEDLETRVKRVRAVEERANRAIRRIVADRPRVDSSVKKLTDLRQTMRGEIHFHVLTQEHNTSRLAGDSWHGHMHDAIGARRDFSGEIKSFGRYVGELESVKRGRPTSAIRQAKQTVDHLRQMSAELQREIDRSRSSLDSHNNQTKLLKEHIRDRCGGRGQRWYLELEQRTAARKPRTTRS
ncbi:hypothetical protein [Actinocrispum wychmicini]|uniref:Uncharacterized protein n=1 Tax=Actinocrispum wychmicini TaxID=1213861 RepID=A0A4V2S436_9PSEU|nr:hypothetical protein [Actinocrispum wychmicini]TCO46700.1 hypothetical protein EV192_11895 [Actinocrispum wychmicini]